MQSGTRLGPYEMLAPLGVGGMGEVWRARDLRLHRDVAVKLLLAESASSSAALARFKREARAVAALSHPNILAIHDFGTDDSGVPFAVIELLDGATLRERLRHSSLSAARAVEWGRQIAALSALEVAYEERNAFLWGRIHFPDFRPLHPTPRWRALADRLARTAPFAPPC